jgi:hypothetical protein
MIEIFIPVLWICINAHCEFMQSDGFYFTQETKCIESLDMQKQRMRELVRQAGQGTITVLEGTCVDAKIKIRIEKQVSGVDNV